jgi:hypothetical protein
MAERARDDGVEGRREGRREGADAVARDLGNLETLEGDLDRSRGTLVDLRRRARLLLTEAAACEREIESNRERRRRAVGRGVRFGLSLGAVLGVIAAGLLRALTG